MKTRGRRIIGFILAAVMTASVIPTALADVASNFRDFPQGWSKVAMEAAVENGLLQGFETGEIKPKDKLTRAQMAAIMVRAFGATTTADISSYKDVYPSKWYYEDIARAVKMGALNGYSDTEMAPDAYITRQEVFTVLARVLVLSSNNTSALAKFKDSSNISSWAVNSMAALTERGYVNGDEFKNVNPKANITREEFAQLMHNAIRTYITKSGTYSGKMDGITVVRTGNVTINNASVTSDLVMGDGVAFDGVRVSNTTVEKRLLARGGIITLHKTTLGENVVVNNVNGITQFMNYRDEAVFKGIVENTTARFLMRNLNVGSGGIYDTDEPDTIYTIRLMVDGDLYDTVKVINGRADHTPEEPEKDYWQFDGWYDENDKKITNLNTVKSNKILTARFIENGYTLEFADKDVNGVDYEWVTGVIKPSAFVYSETGDYPALPGASDIVIPNGYSFASWTYNGTEINSIADIADLPTDPSNIVIAPKFNINIYTLNFVSEDPVNLPLVWKPGAVVPQDFTVKNHKDLPLADSIDAPNGYHFACWKYNDIEIDSSEDIPVLPATDATMDIVAKFEKNTYELTFKAEDGLTLDWVQQPPQSFKVGEEPALPLKADVIAPNGYSFTGEWMYNGSIIDSLEDIAELPDESGTMEIVAKLNVNTYTLAFESENPSVIPLVWKPGTVLPTSFTVKDYKEIPTKDDVIAPEGYFAESLTYNGTIIERLEDILVLPAESATITIIVNYAKTEYTLSYAPETAGTTFSWNGSYQPPVEFEVGDTTLLPAKTDVVVPAGYTFVGWVYNGVIIDSVDDIDDLPLNSSNIELLARITENVYTLKYKAVDENDQPMTWTPSAELPQNFTYSDRPVLDESKLNIPFGYSFDAWIYDGNEITSLDDITTLPDESAEIEITVKFDLNTYTLAFESENPSVIPLVWKPGTVIPTSFTVKDYKEIPKKDDVIAPDGYFAESLTYNGTIIEKLEDILVLPAESATITIIVNYAKTEYTLSYAPETAGTTFSWNGSYQPPVEFEVGDTTLLPAKTDVVVPAGYTFVGWVFNGVIIDSVDDIDDLPIGTDDITILARITENVYTLKYKAVDENDQPMTWTPSVNLPDSFTNAARPVLDENVLEAPYGYSFGAWVYDGNEITSLDDITTLPDESAEIEITVKFKLNIYTLEFKSEDPTNLPLEWVSGTMVPASFTVKDYKNLPMSVDAPNGYSFLYWMYDGSEINSLEEITDLPATDATIEIVAKYEKNTYTLTYRAEDETGNPVSWVASADLPDSFKIGEYPALPEDKVFPPVGYEFGKWMYDGSEINSLEDIIVLPDHSTTIEIVVVLSEKVYKVHYNADFKDGYIPETEYTISNIISLADLTKVVAPDGKKAEFWMDSEDRIVRNLTVNSETLDVLELYPCFEYTPITVYFYEGYNEEFDLGKVEDLYPGDTVPANEFPAIENYMLKTGYQETEEIADVYKNNEDTHTIKPSYWYVDKATNTLKPFDETVVVTEDTNVYLLSRALTLSLMFKSTNQPMSVTAYYNDETRLVNSFKDMAVRGRDQLTLAINNDLIPRYDEATDKLIGRLEDAGVIEVVGDEMQIQILDIPVPVSKLIKEDVANGMVKQYIRDVVKNPSELDKILDFINVAEFADQLGIDQIIANMSEEEIADIITSSQYATTITNSIYSDLTSEESSMMDLVIEYVTENNAFKESLIDQLIAELKDKGATSTLKTKAIEYIEEQLAKGSGVFYDKFVTMVVTDLKSENSVVMDAVVSYVKTTLPKDTEEAKELRKAILTSPKLSDFLKDATMKDKMVDVILTDNFINKALDNKDYRTTLVEAVMDDDDFVDTLLHSSEFHDYIIKQIHHGQHDIGLDVENLLNDKNSKFRKHVLNLVKHDTAFLDLIKTHSELYDIIYDKLSWSEFVANEDDLLKFILSQPEVAGTYSFIDAATVEQVIADEYNASAQAAITGNYETLDPIAKQSVKNALYSDTHAREALINAIKDKFNKYKKDILDEVLAGNADDVTDAKAMSLMDDMLVSYIEKYIEGQELHADATINAAISSAIEEILFGFISDLILGVDLNDAELEAELSTMLSHITDIKHAFVVDADPSAVSRLKSIFKDYRDSHTAQIRNVVSNKYNDLVGQITALINPEAANNVYSEVETVLISVAGSIDASLISGYVKSISDSDIADLVKKYITIVTTEDIIKYIATFLNASNDNVETFKTELRNFLNDPNQIDTIKSFAVTYIKDPLNEDSIKTSVSEFIADIDADFVEENRDVITKAIGSIDVTAFVDKDTIKSYINGLGSDAEKEAFGNKIYDALQNDADYTKLMKSLLNADTFEVNKSNLSMVTAIASAINNLTYDSVIDKIDDSRIDKIINAVGEDLIRGYFDEMKTDYCDGLDDVINEVSSSADPLIKKNYTTSLTVKLNIFDFYNELYYRAQEKVIDKLDKMENVHYSNNDYLKFLATDDILERLVSGDASLANGDFTGYSLKDIIDYYDYVLMLLIVGDDALCYYGNKLTDEQFDALYDAMFGKVFLAHDKVNEILEEYAEDDKLPAKVQSAVDKVQKINNLLTRYESKIKEIIEKYLNSSINAKIENESIKDDEKVVKFIDLLLGKDDPVVNVDTLYALFYGYDDKVQEKLQTLIASGKLEKAVEKFESTSIGKLYKGNGKLGTLADKLDEFKQNGRIESAMDSVYQLLQVVAQEGVEPYRVPSSDVTIRDEYKFTVGQVEMSVKRYYMQ